MGSKPALIVKYCNKIKFSVVVLVVVKYTKLKEVQNERIDLSKLRSQLESKNNKQTCGMP